MLLTLDTACEACSVGLFEGDRLLAGAQAYPGTGHAELLPLQLARLWHDAGLTPRRLQRVAVTIGPGSFTGLRVGLSAAKALVLASGAQLIGVSTLAALAGTVAVAAPPPPRRLLTLIDARRGQVYHQAWSWRTPDQAYVPEAPAQALSLADVTAQGAQEAKGAAGTGVAVVAGLGAALALYPTPEGIAHAARHHGDVLGLDAGPDYLRAPDARPQVPA